MSYRQQLEGVFTPLELSILSKIIDKEHLTSFMSEFSTEERRSLKSIRDKLRGEQNIGNPRTTPPGKL